MYDPILISIAFLLSYVGLYLAVRPLRHEYRKRIKRIVILLCFICSAVALTAAMYISSKNG